MAHTNAVQKLAVYDSKKMHSSTLSGYEILNEANFHKNLAEEF